MQRSRSRRICVEILIGFGKVRLMSMKRLVGRPLLIAWFCSGHSPPLSHVGQSSGWLMSRSSITPCCALSATGDECCVPTTMPGATSIAHDGCGFGIGRTLPSRSGIATSTRHWRHAPTGLSSGWSQKRGIAIPISSAARMMSVPFGTDVSTPSIVRVTRFGSTGTASAPAVLSVVVVMRAPPLLRRRNGAGCSRTARSAAAGTARSRATSCLPRTPHGSTGWRR